MVSYVFKGSGDAIRLGGVLGARGFVRGFERRDQCVQALEKRGTEYRYMVSYVFKDSSDPIRLGGVLGPRGFVRGFHRRDQCVQALEKRGT